MIPLFKPHMPELPLIDDILHSGSLAYGKYSKAFEQNLVEYFQTNQLIVTNSFNMAIAVIISALDIKQGDEVIASPMACLASTQPFASYGINIKWADIDPNTGTLNPDDVRNKISSRTKAIIHNHFCGYVGYIDEINHIGKEFGIPVIDDGIEAFGSLYQGKKIGNCGTDITVFSFNAVRIPTTIDGGAVIFHNKELYEKSILIRDCGIDRTIFRDDIGEISPYCDISLIGHSATMSDVNGYIGLCQMDTIEDIIETQRIQAEKWNSRFENDASIKIIGRKEILPNYWVYGILVNNKRQGILDLRNEGYYASGVHINNNIYSVFGIQPELLGVNEFYNRFVALPCGWWMKDHVQVDKKTDLK